jgi:hypothetical protein
MDIPTLTRFFMWCTIINGLLLCAAAIILMAAGDWVYRTHSKWYPMSRAAFNVAIYSFVGGYKILFITLNLVPFLALKIIA